MARGNYEGLAKMATIFAMIFGVSVGLCGATALLSSVLSETGRVLILVGILELLGMACGAVGLFVVGVFASIALVRAQFKKEDDGA